MTPPARTESAPADRDSTALPRVRRDAEEQRNAAGQRTRPPALPSTEPANAPDLESHDQSLRRSFYWWGRTAFALGATFLGIELLGIARGVVSAFVAVILLGIFGAIVALLCAPLAKLLDRRLPRTLAVALSLGLFVFFIVGLIALVSAPLISEGKALFSDLPRLQRPLDGVTSWLSDRGIQVGSLDLKGLVGHAFGSSPSSIAGVVVNAISGTFSLVVDFAVVMVTAFWLLRDAEGLERSVVASMPATWRPHAEFVLDAAAVVVGGYVRAQAALALLVGTLAGLGCALLHVPFPLVIGVATGLFELIPMVGALVGAAVGALLALTVGPTLVVWTLILFLGIHIVEGYLIAPRVQARFVRIHPLIAFLALFAGVEIGGFLGALFAVPVASLAALLLRSVLGDMRANRPELFDSSAAPADRGVAGRRRRLLGEYRLFKGNPLRALRKRLQRG